MYNILSGNYAYNFTLLDLHVGFYDDERCKPCQWDSNNDQRFVRKVAGLNLPARIPPSVLFAFESLEPFINRTGTASKLQMWSDFAA